VVILSPWPFTALLTPLCQYAGPAVFSYGLQMMQQVSGGGEGGGVSLCIWSCLGADARARARVCVCVCVPFNTWQAVKGTQGPSSQRRMHPAASSTLPQVYEEVCGWPPLELGACMSLPLGMGTLTADIPELSTLPLSTLNTLPPPPGPAAANGASTQVLLTPDNSPAVKDLQAGGGSAALPPPSAAAPPPPSGAQDCGGSGGSSCVEFDVAAALLDELDLDTGLPLCLLPQAYGQQELVRGPFGEVRRVGGRGQAFFVGVLLFLA
jgi:hypothetical protein